MIFKWNYSSQETQPMSVVCSELDWKKWSTVWRIINGYFESFGWGKYSSKGWTRFKNSQSVRPQSVAITLSSKVFMPPNRIKPSVLGYPDVDPIWETSLTIADPLTELQATRFVPSPISNPLKLSSITDTELFFTGIKFSSSQSNFLFDHLSFISMTEELLQLVEGPLPWTHSSELSSSFDFSELASSFAFKFSSLLSSVACKSGEFGFNLFTGSDGLEGRARWYPFGKTNEGICFLLTWETYISIPGFQNMNKLTSCLNSSTVPRMSNCWDSWDLTPCFLCKPMKKAVWEDVFVVSTYSIGYGWHWSMP